MNSVGGIGHDGHRRWERYEAGNGTVKAKTLGQKRLWNCN